MLNRVSFRGIAYMGAGEAASMAAYEAAINYFRLDNITVDDAFLKKFKASHIETSGGKHFVSYGEDDRFIRSAQYVMNARKHDFEAGRLSPDDAEIMGAAERSILELVSR